MPQPVPTPAPDLSSVLTSNPLMKRLSPEQLQAIAAALSPRTFSEGEQLYTPEAPLQGLIVLYSGLLQVRWPQPVGFATTHLAKGQVLGGYRPVQLQADPSAAPLPLGVVASCDGLLYEMSLSALDALSRAPCWKHHQYQDFIDTLDRNAALVAGPAWGKLLAKESWLLSEAIKPAERSGAAPVTLFGPGKKAEGMYIVGLNSVVQVTRVAQGVTVGQFQLGYGAVVGVGDFWRCDDMPADGPTPPEHGAGRQVRGGSVEVTATLVSGEAVWLLSAHTVHAHVRRGPHLFVEKWPWLDAFLDNLAEVERVSDEAVTALQKELAYNNIHIQRNDLYPVLQAGQSQLWRVNVPSPAPTGDLPGVSVIVQGEVLSQRTQFPFTSRQLIEPGMRAVPMHVFRAPSVVGLIELLTDAPRTDPWTARVPTRAVFISSACMRGVLGEATLVPPAWAATVNAQRVALRESVVLDTLKAAVEAVHEHRVVAGQALRWPGAELTLLSPLQSSGAPWTPLLRLLMAEIFADFNERCLLLHLSTDGDPSQQAWPWGDEVTLVVPADVEGAIRALSARRDLLASRRYSQVFIDLAPSARGLRGICHAVDSLLYLNQDPLAPLPQEQPYGVPYTYTTLLPANPADAEQTVYPPNTVRLRFDQAVLASPPGGIEGANAQTREVLSRWARAATGRRVGVGLAGGGIWGMAHIPVLRGMASVGVPVDIVAGASDGAHVAAWYCSLGLPGLDTLMEPRTLRRLNVVNFASFVTLEAFVWWLNRHLGGATLPNLETICVPVGTDVITGSEVPVLRGGVAAGVRMSASLTPIYPSTPGPQRTWLDGAFSSNLPTMPLIQEGASLMVVSNVVQPKPGLKARPPRIGGTFGRVMADLNPMRRIWNTWYGLLTLGYSVGEKSVPEAATHFDSAWTDTLFINVLSSPEVVADMESLPETRQVLLAVRERWRRLAAPRVDPKG